MFDLVEQTCCRCQTKFAIHRDIYRVACERREKFGFYCPNGHAQHFVTGETEIDKLRRERDVLKQRIAQKDDEIAHQRNIVISAKGQITKLKKRAKAGVCPCCSRTFANMAAHMKTKHPEFDPSVIDLDAEKAKRKTS